jgi:hypothetical protein
VGTRTPIRAKVGKSGRKQLRVERGTVSGITRQSGVEYIERHMPSRMLYRDAHLFQNSVAGSDL